MAHATLRAVELSCVLLFNQRGPFDTRGLIEMLGSGEPYLYKSSLYKDAYL